ncbi:MAG TPA: hypothetical protein VGM90_22875 [Kofleriaceae bacterium]|jgi:hypothetical protein
MRVSIVVSSLVIAALFVLAPSRADAGGDPNKQFAGKIMLSDKRFPMQAKSPAAFTANVKKLSKTAFTENKESKSWKIYMIGFLKSPLNDLEYIVKIYEVGGKGGNSLLQSFEQYTDSNGQKTLTSNITLERKTFGVNKELMITMESKGKVLASGRFKIIGEGDHFSGKVDFSKDDDEDGAKKDE